MTVPRENFGGEWAQSQALREISAPSIARMATLRRFRSDSRTNFDAEAISQLAERQHGVVSRKQLLGAGVGSATIARWLAAARLHRVHPHVYALGHAAVPLEGRLIAALLYGGDQAVLSHTTAAWVWSLIDVEPRRIHLTIPGRRRSLPDVCVHRSRQIERANSTDLRQIERAAGRDLPVTSVARTLVDIAAILSFRAVRRALAEAEYQGLLSAGDVRSVLKSGRRGSSSLRRALDQHLPQLARTLSVLEERFLELCDSAGLPSPELNAKVGGMRVDALWQEQGLVAELDGAAAHGGWAQVSRDREREMALRRMGFRVVRYTRKQVTERPAEVVADLRRQLGHSSGGDRVSAPQDPR